MATKSVMTGSTIYDKVFKLVDYTGEITQSADVVGYKYSDKFSPNNIKRLIISPDCVMVHYHTPIQGGVKQQKVMLNPTELQICSNLEDYKPIMNILSTNRICSSIEEVIFLVNSKNPNIQLTSREYAFENLVKNYTGRSGSSLSETVANRYKRLYSFTIAYMCFDEFMLRCKNTPDINKCNFLSDLPFFESANKQYIHKEDWWKSWGSAAKTYTMDAIGGVLHNHFTSVKSNMEIRLKQEAVNESKAKLNKDLIKDVETRFKRYSSLVKLSNRLNKLVAECGTNGISTESFKPYQMIELYKCSVIGNYPKVIDGTSETDNLKKNNEILRLEVSKLVFHLSSCFIKSFYTVVEDTPITAKVLYNTCNESTIIVPSDVESLNQIINLHVGKSFDGTSIPDSIINTCWLYCSFFLDRNSEKFEHKVVTREYWKGALT